mmetsp:Transcript_20312/g.51985  ORF Transcript_20312/g.51985 Transcript_20312/m.51985 type:complete len:190 (-) Transcript_20312:29-598(-)|eukprot:jgi/Tetstr1/432013/TSEL_021489.t1
MAPRLDILAAVYTSVLDVSPDGNKGRDVTAAVRDLVDADNQRVVFPKGANLNKLLGGDPEPFHPKMLKVLYQVDGVDWPPMKVFEALCKVKEQIVPAPSGPAPPPKRLEILKGEWGEGAQTLVVTPQLLEMVEDDSRLPIPASMKLVKVFGDPAMGKAKTLTIAYKFDGQLKDEVVLGERRKEDVVIGI